jgi:predicted enzyme related to lactoylglutathione lyase
MGKAVVHFEVMGKDGDKLRQFYSELFGWEIDADNPMNYGIVQRDGNTNADGVGIGGGVGQHPQGETNVTFYIEVDDVAADLKRAEELGGATAMPETDVMEGVTIGQFTDPEGNRIGVVKAVPQG